MPNCSICNYVFQGGSAKLFYLQLCVSRDECQIILSAIMFFSRGECKTILSAIMCFKGGVPNCSICNYVFRGVSAKLFYLQLCFFRGVSAKLFYLQSCVSRGECQTIISAIMCFKGGVPNYSICNYVLRGVSAKLFYLQLCALRGECQTILSAIMCFEG